MTATRKPKPPALHFIHPSELNLHHRNARVGDVDAIAGSLKVNNQYKPLIVNKGTHTGRPNEVLAGNHTLKAIRQLGEKFPEDERWDHVMVLFTDVDEDSATRVLLADNQTSAKGGMDDELLYDLLTDLPGLEGTGFEQDDLDELAALQATLNSTLDVPKDDDDRDVTIDLGKLPKECSEAGIVVGVVRVKVPTSVYQAWYDNLRNEISYEDKDLQAEILRRLGLTA